MPTSTLLAPSSAGSRFKTILWVSLGLTVLFVFITSELLLITDYPMYHAYRLQVIADRHLLIPHTLAGIFALLIGPINFSSRISPAPLAAPSRSRPHLCRVRLCRCPSPGSLSLPADRASPEPPCRPLRGWSAPPPPSLPRATAKSPCIANGWPAPMRSRLPSSPAACSISVPAYWSHLGDVLAAVGVIAFTLASLLIVDLGLNWHELTTRRN